MPEIHSSFFRESRSFYNLKLLSEKLGIAEEEGKNVSEYYVIEMQTTGLDVVDGIDEKIKEFEENMILSEYSPKVIMV